MKQEVIARIEKLSPTPQGKWGKMNILQMMAHCTAAMDMALGKLVSRRTLIGRIIGPRLRHVLTDGSSFPGKGPTAKELKIAAQVFRKNNSA